MWKGTTKLGCALAVVNRKNKKCQKVAVTFVVCHYCKHGNVKGGGPNNVFKTTAAAIG